MVFQIIPICPNQRAQYQEQVKDLCNLLKDGVGSRYRFRVFRLLCIPAKATTGLRRFREHPEAKRFLQRDYPADVTAYKIMEELDKIYGAPITEIDHLRGAVGEVFAYFICRKRYPSTAGIEVKVEVDSWISDSIDTAGCNQNRGHCLQSKCSALDTASIDKQKRDFDKIEELTTGKAEGFFITFVDRGGFESRLLGAGIDASDYKVFDRTDLAALEQRLSE